FAVRAGGRLIPTAGRAQKGLAAAAGLPRAASYGGDGLPGRRRGTRPAEAPEQQRDADDLPRALRRSPTRSAARPYGNPYGNNGRQQRTPTDHQRERRSYRFAAHSRGAAVDGGARLQLTSRRSRVRAAHRPSLTRQPLP